MFRCGGPTYTPKWCTVSSGINGSTRVTFNCQMSCIHIRPHRHLELPIPGVCTLNKDRSTCPDISTFTTSVLWTTLGPKKTRAPVLPKTVSHCFLTDATSPAPLCFTRKHFKVIQNFHCPSSRSAVSFGLLITSPTPAPAFLSPLSSTTILTGAS